MRAGSGRGPISGELPSTWRWSALSESRAAPCPASRNFILESACESDNFSMFVGVYSVSEFRAPRGFPISLDVDLIQTCEQLARKRCSDLGGKAECFVNDSLRVHGLIPPYCPRRTDGPHYPNCQPGGRAQAGSHAKYAGRSPLRSASAGYGNASVGTWSGRNHASSAVSSLDEIISPAKRVHSVDGTFLAAASRSINRTPPRKVVV